jgi:hypothetical protein
MERNVASQEVRLFAFDYSTGAPKTGLTNLTAYVAKGTGAPVIITAASGVMTEIDSTNAPGAYKIALSQGETDATDLMFTARSATSNVACVARFVTTTPPNYASLAIDGTNFAVKVQNGTGTGQVSLTSGAVTVGTNNDKTGYTASTVSDKTGYALTSGERTSIADALLDRDMATGSDTSTTSGATGRTVRSALRVLRNKFSLVTGKSYKEDDSTTNFDFTVTTDGAAVPITVSDPA